MPDTDPNKDPSAPSGERLSERRFRRYHRAEARRRKAAREDSHFFRAVFSIAGVGAALAIGLAVFAMTGGRVGSDVSSLMQPWLGPFSQFEILGFIFIAFMGALFLWRVRRR